MKLIYDLLELDKRNNISYSIGFVSNVLILTLLFWFFLSFSIIFIFLLCIFVNNFILMIFSSNIYVKFIILFFLLILLKLRQKQDLAKDIDMKLKKYFDRQDAEGLIKYKAIIMMLCVYISLCLLGLMLYNFTGNQIINSNKSDIINIFIWATYLLAPIVAIWAYSNWKEQKTYELEKQYAEKLLENMHEIYFNMLERVSILRFLSNINNEVVMLNDINTHNYVDKPFYIAHGILDLLNLISHKKVDKSMLVNFERMAQFLDGHSKFIEMKYQMYYRDMPKDLKNTQGVQCTTYENIILTKEQLFAKVQLSWYLNDKLESEAIEDNGDILKFNLSFNEYIENLRTTYTILADQLVSKYIKIKNN